MTRRLEYLEEAIQEGEAAARWYAERSPLAAATRILIVAIAHAHRRPGYWTSRIDVTD